MSDIRVLIVPADESEQPHVSLVEASHDVFVDLVDDVNTDTVFFDDDTGIAIVAANGKSMASHVANPRGTQTLERWHRGFAKVDRIEGPAVFVGLDADQDFTDVPDEVIAFVKNFRWMQ